MAPADSATVLGWLKAAGEDSRLRLLALCARHDMSVSDLAEALRQSEPRVSRHLRILCEAGLLERSRQGQWVHYRLTQNAAAAGFANGLLGQMDRNDPLFARDRQRALGESSGRASTSSGRAHAAGALGQSRLGRALKGFVEAVDVGIGESTRDGGERGAGGTVGVTSDAGREGPTSALVVGVEHLELLETAASMAGGCVAIAHSRRAAQSARAFAERRAFACRVLLAAGPGLLCQKDIDATTGAQWRESREAPVARRGATGAQWRESPAGTGGPFEVVFLDHLARSYSALDALLTYARRALSSDGRLWVFERYESLAGTRGKVVEHPIGRLRRLLGDVGLTCERLSPIEADGEHVIAAVAVPSQGISRGTGTTG
jgi:DNA-binding transcriptional ArsR family regulator